MNYGLIGAIGGLGKGLSSMAEDRLKAIRAERLADIKRRWDREDQAEERRYTEGRDAEKFARDSAEHDRRAALKADLDLESKRAERELPPGRPKSVDLKRMYEAQYMTEQDAFGNKRLAKGAPSFAEFSRLNGDDATVYPELETGPEEPPEANPEDPGLMDRLERGWEDLIGEDDAVTSAKPPAPAAKPRPPVAPTTGVIDSVDKAKRYMYSMLGAIEKMGGTPSPADIEEARRRMLQRATPEVRETLKKQNLG
jgi:hypothetical protein